jgi:hypothetical protein
MFVLVLEKTVTEPLPDHLADPDRFFSPPVQRNQRPLPRSYSQGALAPPLRATSKRWPYHWYMRTTANLWRRVKLPGGDVQDTGCKETGSAEGSLCP